MPKGKKIPARIKKKVIEFHQDGLGLDQNEIANELLISQTSVSQILKEWKKRMSDIKKGCETLAAAITQTDISIKELSEGFKLLDKATIEHSLIMLEFDSKEIKKLSDAGIRGSMAGKLLKKEMKSFIKSKNKGEENVFIRTKT